MFKQLEGGEYEIIIKSKIPSLSRNPNPRKIPKSLRTLITKLGQIKHTIGDKDLTLSTPDRRLHLRVRAAMELHEGDGPATPSLSRRRTCGRMRFGAEGRASARNGRARRRWHQPPVAAVTAGPLVRWRATS